MTKIFCNALNILVLDTGSLSPQRFPRVNERASYLIGFALAQPNQQDRWMISFSMRMVIEDQEGYIGDV